MDKIIKSALAEHKKAFQILEQNLDKLKDISDLFIYCLKNNGKLIFIGNGGSAADAQHLAAEFSGRFKKNRAPLAGLALTTNTSALTAIGNDFGFEEIFSRQLQALANNNDVLVALSTSGNSKNIISAVEKAKALGLKTIGFLGNDGGKLKTLVDLALTITCSDTPSIQEMHILAGHIACSITESKLEG